MPPSSRRKIALVWQGSPTHERDHERSIPFSCLTPFIGAFTSQTSPSFQADFYSLIPSTPETHALTSLAPLIHDFADTAALLKQMDLLITVDTATAHLAGALGIPTIVLLPFCPDWRWGVDGESSAWYPSLTLVRQKKYGDWSGVIDELTALLKRRFRESA